jgi:hypothetical protein
MIISNELEIYTCAADNIVNKIELNGDMYPLRQDLVQKRRKKILDKNKKVENLGSTPRIKF